jgi:anti-sigma factor RsiW
MGFSASDFEKKRFCPAAQVLVSYHQHHLSDEQRSQIASHLAACDFCVAELQLLVKFSPTIEVCESPKMPESLRVLATALLRKSNSAIRRSAG